MVFGSHPINRHKVISWVSRFQVPNKIDGRYNFIDNIQRPRKNIELVTRRNGEGIVIEQQREIWLRRNISVLFFETFN